MSSDIVNRIDSYLEEVKKRHKITYKDENVHQDIINYITRGVSDKKKERCFSIFMTIVNHITKGEGHKIGSKKEIEESIGPDERLAVFYEEINVRKKGMYREIQKIDICPESPHRKSLGRY